MDDKAKKALIEEAKHAQEVAQEVALSGAYIYPFKVRYPFDSFLTPQLTYYD